MSLVPPAELGVALIDTTFVVIDLETTGGSPELDAITEIGAVRLRGGECLGTFQTLVDPGLAIPPAVTYLTGITQAMVGPAPRIDEVLSALLEFLGDAVLVGHNAGFDRRFLDANLRRTGRESLTNLVVDTCTLARRLLQGEVDDCKLATLARHFRTDVEPCHRALADAQATGEVLHCLLERVASLGVTGLDDLLALPRTTGHPHMAKLRLIADLPRAPGVYLFRDSSGQVIYVGSTTNLRRQVRSYFAGRDRRAVGARLRELQSIDHMVCSSDLEAAVRQLRLARELSPPHNRRAARWRQYAYVKLGGAGRPPLLSVVKSPKRDDGCHYLGPLPSMRVARTVVEALESLNRLGCAAGQTAQQMERTVGERVVTGLAVGDEVLVRPLAREIERLTAAHRLDEAGQMQDQMSALSGALSQQRRLDDLRGSGRTRLDLPDGSGAMFDGGRLIGAWGRGRLPWIEPLASPVDVAGPVPRELVDELLCVTSWLDRRAGRVQLVPCDDAAGLGRPARQSDGGSANWAAACSPSTDVSGRPNGSWKLSGPAAAPSSAMVASPE